MLDFSKLYAFANPGIEAQARYLGAPDPLPLIQTLEMMKGATANKKELLSRTDDIASMVSYWEKVSDINEGYDKIKAASTKYLPKFPDEKSEEYTFRLENTKLTNVYVDIVEGLASKPFEEEISFAEGEEKSEPPQEIKDFIENVDGNGNNLTVFGSLTFYNGINYAIDWIFVDYPPADPLIRTRADEIAAGVRPFWSHVLAQNVLEVRTTNINGTHVLSYIRIHEPGVGEPERVRIFQRDINGTIIYQLWELNKDNDFVLIDNGTLTIDVIPLVPFVTGRRDGATWKFTPPMRAALELQFNLYRNESALEHLCILAGYPMLAANGLRPQMGPDGKTPMRVAVGPGRVVYGLPNENGTNGKWEYIEPSGASMEFLQKKNNETKQDLRELGRQPLTAQSGNLTVITTAVAAGKARSAVGAWALQLKDAIENALVITAKWLKKDDYDPEINVYTDFDNFADGGADLAELGSARRAGDLSQETYWYELRRRKVLSPEFNAEKEREKLLEEIPGDGDLENPDDLRNNPRKTAV